MLSLFVVFTLGLLCGLGINVRNKVPSALLPGTRLAEPIDFAVLERVNNDEYIAEMEALEAEREAMQKSGVPK